MSKHIVDRPLAAARGTVQSRSRQTAGQRGDVLGLLCERGQDLLDRELCVIHESYRNCAGMHGSVSPEKVGARRRAVLNDEQTRPQPSDAILQRSAATTSAGSWGEVSRITCRRIAGSESRSQSTTATGASPPDSIQVSPSAAAVSKEPPAIRCMN